MKRKELITKKDIAKEYLQELLFRFEEGADMSDGKPQEYLDIENTIALIDDLDQ